MIERLRSSLVSLLAISLGVFTIYEVNYGVLPPLSQLAVFALLGIILCFLMYPLRQAWKDVAALRIVDLLLSVAFAACCGYLLWEGRELTNERVGRFTPTDFAVAITATLLVLEATRRSIGLALPILAGAFLLYAYYGAQLPDWLFPHRGYDIERIAAQCFLGTKGIFGVAMRVMFTYVFLFVVFGAFLEMSGATQFIIDFAKRIFGSSPGGPAKVAVLGSGLMGSLSGSAVANAVTTGTFTIPMMRSGGFREHISGGITAAAASGGALVPPVMGAGAYMMLEIVDPTPSFLQIAKAALVPAILYYLSILLIVHFYSLRIGSVKQQSTDEPQPSLLQYQGLVFFAALGTLIAFLLLRYTPFRAVTYSLEVILLLSIVSPKIEIGRWARIAALMVFVVATTSMVLFRMQYAAGDVSAADWTTWTDAGIVGMLAVMLLGLLQRDWRPRIHEAFVKSAKGGIALVSASACVGIIIGVVSLTGVGTAFPNAIVPLAEESLLLALVAIMLCSIVLGMGLPSAVCYLLMATLIGPVLGQLGVIPLAAHLFIFYFGMMSMVTPPVALAAYASASIAKAEIMPTAMAAFRFSLVGFTLPFMFIYRPALMLMDGEKWGAWMSANAAGSQQADELLRIAAEANPPLLTLLLSLGAAVIGIVSLAAALAGYLRAPLSWPARIALLVAAGLLLAPIAGTAANSLARLVDFSGAIVFGVILVLNWRAGLRTSPEPSEETSDLAAATQTAEN